jgi:thymidylate synthase ThyX
MPITKFDPEEEKLLEPYVTSTTANVFALKNLQGIVGPAFARYSRAKGGVRDVLLKEFIKDGIMDPVHANDLIARILIQYGDDSVGELEGAHLSFEQISVLQTKDIEDRRIGGSPIEQSTRYVFYDQKDIYGNWLYYRGSELIHSSFGEQYRQTMDFIFQTYSDLIEPLKNYLETQKPIEEAEYDINGDDIKEKWHDLTNEKSQKSFRLTYTMDLRTKACDVLRGLLPLSTKTNLGLFGNGRYYQEMLSHLLTTELPESHKNAALAKEALDQIIPQYVKRAKRRDYNAAVNEAMFKLSAELLSGTTRQLPKTLPEYTLVDRGEQYIESQIKAGASIKDAITEFEYICILASMLYSYCDLSLTQLRELVISFDEKTKQKIWDTYLGDRTNCRNRPGRALESSYPYTFDLVTNFGVYKDLERHRMNTQQRQLFTTKLGFDVPEEIKKINAVEVWQECFQKADQLFKAMEAENPVLAQYAVLHGHYVRWMLGINDRAIMHLLELRSTPQGHPQYRLASQEIHKLIMERDARRGNVMKFVDYNDYYWSRADSEARQRAKEAKLDKNSEQ